MHVPTRVVAHLLAHPEMTPALLGTACALLSMPTLQRVNTKLAVEIDTKLPLKTALVTLPERVLGHKTFTFARRAGRRTLTPVVCDPSVPLTPTSTVTVVVHRADDQNSYLKTAYVGNIAVAEPGAAGLSDADVEVSLTYWSRHALKYDANTMGPVVHTSWQNVVAERGRVNLKKVKKRRMLLRRAKRARREEEAGQDEEEEVEVDDVDDDDDDDDDDDSDKDSEVDTEGKEAVTTTSATTNVGHGVLEARRLEAVTWHAADVDKDNSSSLHYPSPGALAMVRPTFGLDFVCQMQLNTSPSRIFNGPKPTRVLSKPTTLCLPTNSSLDACRAARRAVAADSANVAVARVVFTPKTSDKALAAKSLIAAFPAALAALDAEHVADWMRAWRIATARVADGTKLRFRVSCKGPGLQSHETKAELGQMLAARLVELRPDELKPELVAYELEVCIRQHPTYGEAHISLELPPPPPGDAKYRALLSEGIRERNEASKTQEDENSIEAKKKETVEACRNKNNTLLPTTLPSAVCGALAFLTKPMPNAAILHFVPSASETSGSGVLAAMRFLCCDAAYRTLRQPPAAGDESTGLRFTSFGADVADGSMDAVVMDCVVEGAIYSEALEYDHMRNIVTDAMRVLRTGGRFIAFVPPRKAKPMLQELSSVAAANTWILHHTSSVPSPHHSKRAEPMGTIINASRVGEARHRERNTRKRERAQMEAQMADVAAAEQAKLERSAVERAEGGEQ